MPAGDLTVRVDLGEISTLLTEILGRMSTLATQEDVDAIQAAIAGFADRLETSITGIRQDFADFKTANPTIDLTGLEATVNTRLASIADSAAELDAENPAPPPGG